MSNFEVYMCLQDHQVRSSSVERKLGFGNSNRRNNVVAKIRFSKSIVSTKTIVNETFGECASKKYAMRLHVTYRRGYSRYH